MNKVVLGCSSLVVASILVGLVHPFAPLPAANTSPITLADAGDKSIAPAPALSQDMAGAGMADAGMAGRSVIGRLEYPVELDADNDSSTNPRPGKPVPVSQLATFDASKEVRYAAVDLGVSVMPQSQTRNPNGTPVQFHIWSDDRTIDFTRAATADSWGAASTEILINDLEFNQRLHYSASAAGYGELPERTFTVDPLTVKSALLFGGVRSSTSVDSNGRVTIDVASDLPIDDQAGAVQIAGVRLVALSTEMSDPRREPLPPIVARRVDAHHAVANIYLDKGDYLFSPVVVSGAREAHGDAELMHVASSTPPPIGALDDVLSAGAISNTAVAQYYTPQGDAALVTWPLNDLQQATDRQAEKPAQQSTFTQVSRLGAFKWRSQTFKLTVQTSGDSRKIATLDGFQYDPIARTYTIKVQSQMTHTVQDKITLQAIGPNGVVIYEQTMPVSLDPANPFITQFRVPAEKGEPKGLRVIVHDPSIITWLLDNVVVTMSELFHETAGILPKGIDVQVGINASLKFFGFVVLFDVKVTCAVGQGCVHPKDKGLLFASSAADIYNTLLDGLRDQFRDFPTTVDVHTGNGLQIFLDFLKKFVPYPISVGSISAPFTIKGTYTVFDPKNCPTKQDELAFNKFIKGIGDLASDAAKSINKRLSSLQNSVQPKPITIDFEPYASFLEVQIKPIFSIGKIDAGATDPPTGLYASLSIEIGVSLGLFADIPNILKYFEAALAFYDMFDTIRTYIIILKDSKAILSIIDGAVSESDNGVQCATGGGSGGSGGNNGGGHGGHKAVPYPNGNPDDRQDAFQTELLPQPAGISGQIQQYEQQLNEAQRKGLNRAALYLDLQLKQAQLDQYTSDPQKDISLTMEISNTTVNYLDQLQGILSGTIPITPGQTITDAMQAAEVDFGNNIGNTPTQIRSKELQDAVDFAQSRYNGLLGQELELQNELRQVNGEVGVLDTGLSSWAAAAFGTFGIVPKFIHILPSEPGDAAYVAPGDAPPVVVVPTGGLNRYQGDDQARQWLEAYASGGGILIVLDQYENPDWDLLPGGQVHGLGYKDDILCRDNSVRIINPSLWTTGIDHDLPNIQVDGSFTSWPASASVVLMRTTGNQMPAMIEYPFGAGRVVATSSYPDFYVNGMQSLDDIQFARSLFAEAYLVASQGSLAATVNPLQQVQLPFQYTNNSALTMTELIVFPDFYNNQIGDSWRWAAHAPSRGVGNVLLPLNPPLLPGESRSLIATLTAPVYEGIVRMAAADITQGYAGGFISGPFYQTRSHIAGFDTLLASLTPDRPTYDYGSLAVLTATVNNSSAAARTFILTPTAGLNVPPVTLIAPANGSASHVYTTTVTGSRDVRFQVGENGSIVSYMLATLTLRRPALGVSTAPVGVVQGVTTSVAITATAISVAPGTPVTVTLLQHGNVLYATTAMLQTVTNYLEAHAQATLPAAPPGGSFIVRAEFPPDVCPQSRCSIDHAVPVLPVADLGEVQVNGTLQMGSNNPNAISVSLLNNQAPGTAQLQTSFNTPGAVQTVTVNGPDTLLLDLAIPSNLEINAPYSASVQLTTQADGSDLAYSASNEEDFDNLIPPSVNVLVAALKAGDPLVVNLSDAKLAPQMIAVKLPPATPYTVTLDGPDGFTQVYQVTDAAVIAVGTKFTLTVPDVTEPGNYSISIDTPAFPGWIGQAQIQVIPQHVSFSAPAGATAGQIVTLVMSNTGGVNTTVTGTLTLLDPAGIALAHTDITTPLGIGASASFTLAVPSQLISTAYDALQFIGVDHLGNPVAYVQAFAVTGLTISMLSRTDRVAYLTTDVVSTSSTINTNQPLSGATLRLRVLKAATAGPGAWTADHADPGMSNHVPTQYNGALSINWSAAHDAYTAHNPVSVGDLVVLVDTSAGEVQARNSASGDLVWHTSYSPYGGEPQAIAANSTTVFLQTGSMVAALDGLTGAEKWTQTAYSSNYALLATDDALAALVYQNQIFSDAPGKGMGGLARPSGDLADGNYALLDPATGALRGYVPAKKGGLFSGSNLVLYGNDPSHSNDLTAYDAVSGAIQWQTTANGYLLMLANANVILMSDGVNLYAYSAADGSLLNTVALMPGFDPSSTSHNQYAFLRDDFFYYLINTYGGGYGSPGATDIYRINLTSGSQDQLVLNPAPAGAVQAMIGAGASIYLLNNATPRTLITLDQNGVQLNQQDISLITAYNLYGLAASPSGLLVSHSDGVTALLCNVNAAGSAPTGGVVVLREDTLPVDGNGAVVIDHVLDNLSSDTRARGPLFLEGALFSAEPQSITDTNHRQLLAVSYYAFTIDDAAAAVTLASDHPSYRANVPGYPADNALSTVNLSGDARNTSALASDVVVTVTRSDGVVLYSHLTPNMAPGGDVTFAIADSQPPTGTVVYTATTNLGGLAAVTVLVRPVNLSATATFNPSPVYLGAPSRLELALHNLNANEPGMVTVNWGDRQDTYTLNPGALLNVGHTYTPTQAGPFTPTLTFSGDTISVNQAALDVRDDSLSASASLAGVTRTATTLVETSDSAISITLTNDNPYTVSAQVDYTVHSQQIQGSAVADIPPASAQTISVPLANLEPGSHTATFTVTSVARGAVLGVVSIAFNVVAPAYGLTLNASAGDTPPSLDVPINIDVMNAITSDLAWHGAVVVLGAINSRNAVTLNPGDSFFFTSTLELGNLSGRQTIVVQLVDNANNVLAERMVALTAPPRAAPAVSLTGLTASSGSPGSQIALTAALHNAGPDGDVYLTFMAFDQVYQQLVAAPAYGDTTAQLVVKAPSSLLAGTYQAVVKLGQQQFNADVVLTGASLTLTQSLDKPVYMPNSPLIYSVVVRGVSGAPAPYDVSLRFNGQEYTQTVTIGAGDQAPVQATFTTGQVSDRATVLISNHPTNSDDTRRMLLIDSQWAPVVEDSRGYLTSDKDSYNAGDTIILTYHLLRPVYNAMVLAPDAIPTSTGFMVWSALNTFSNTLQISTQGDYAMSYHLPETMKTGRYFFRYYLDDDQRFLPVDVHGITLNVEEFDVASPRSTLSDGDTVTVSAKLRLNQALSATVDVIVIAPDGSAYPLYGAAADYDLSSGANPVQLSGTFNAAMAGEYQIVLRVHDAATGIVLGGDGRYRDVGVAQITSLSTDHGVYAPDQPAVGKVALFNSGAAQLQVATSGGSILVNQAVTVQGHSEYTFTVPTAVEGDEVLIGVVTGNDGLTTTLQSAYKVASTFDITPPQALIQSPASLSGTGVVNLQYAAQNELNITVSGLVTDNAAMGSVVVNGVTATLSGGSWSAPAVLTDGLNAIDVFATDAAGNTGYDSILIDVQPQTGIAFTLSPAQSTVGSVLTAQTEVTSAEAMSYTVRYPFTQTGLDVFDATASSGEIVQTSAEVMWQGVVGPDAPVMITWFATATIPMSGTADALLLGNGFAQFSNMTPYTIGGASTVTDTPTPTSTNTPTPTSTSTPTATPTNKPTPTSTKTPTPTPTKTPTPTSTKTPTPTPTNTPTPTPTGTGGGQITPQLVCVAQTGANKYLAYFGYKNTTGKYVTIRVGANNMFSPPPAYRLQPIIFIPGIFFFYPTVAVIVPFNGSDLTWTLNGTSVTANRNSVKCRTGN